MFCFVAGPEGRVRITCTLEYARWLVNTGRVKMGVYGTPTNVIFL